MFGWRDKSSIIDCEPTEDNRPKCTVCMLPVDGLPDSVVKSREFRVVCSDGCAVALGKISNRCK